MSDDNGRPDLDDTLRMMLSTPPVSRAKAQDEPEDAETPEDEAKDDEAEG